MAARKLDSIPRSKSWLSEARAAEARQREETMDNTDTLFMKQILSPLKNVWLVWLEWHWGLLGSNSCRVGPHPWGGIGSQTEGAAESLPVSYFWGQASLS
jgi:hypothetical protein